jgi:hypothetical protein
MRDSMAQRCPGYCPGIAIGVGEILGFLGQRKLLFASKR